MKNLPRLSAIKDSSASLKPAVAYLSGSRPDQAAQAGMISKKRLLNNPSARKKQLKAAPNGT